MTRPIVEEVQARVTRGSWSVSGEELFAWVVARSLATGVFLEGHNE